MSSINTNIYAQTRERFLDVSEEPRRMLQPIEGYQELSLVSLEEAVEPIISLCPYIRRQVFIAKENCQNLSSNTLEADQAASIYLYTMEWQPKSECLHMTLNTVLRSENRDEIRPWLLYLKLILSGLFQLPSNRMVVWRGVKHNAF